MTVEQLALLEEYSEWLKTQVDKLDDDKDEGQDLGDEGWIVIFAMSCQGTNWFLSYVRVDRISSDGQLIPLYELDRSNFSTPAAAFVDNLSHLAFSPDGQWLALFESSRIYHAHRPAGWRGNIVLYAVETRELQWQASLDVQGTSDHRTLAEAGYPTGFFTELLFVDNTEIACGATQGLIVCYNVATG